MCNTISITLPTTRRANIDIFTLYEYNKRCMKIYFSNQDHLRNFKLFLNTLDLSSPDNLTITTDPERIIVHPAHLALAASLAIKAGKNHSVIKGPIPSSGRILAEMRLFDFLSTPPPFTLEPAREQSGRYIPLRVIKTQKEQSAFIADMVPLLHLPEEKARIIRYIIGELVRNVLEHSHSEYGAIVAARYYAKSNKVSLAICDTGIGIWRSMSPVWHPHTDLAAIRLALSPGITGTTRKEGGTFENAGAGLFYVRSIAKTTRNYFLIYSGKAEYMLTKWDKRLSPKIIADPLDEEHTSTDEAPDFPGTLVALDISLDNATSEFDDLLHTISNAYDSAIRERRRKKFYTPNLIRRS